MELHEKIRTVETDLKFLREQREEAMELREAIHKDAAYPLWKEQDEKVKKAEEDIMRKERDLQLLQSRLQGSLF
ncbi:hypothetical protein [Rufibacter roseus]|nr:hypothetical protein [Rufibacter roseus]